ncbi:hypothetical protein AVEN_272937-1 [Araneus ventricosus]|uniref:Uncharacterized protein n=1 Tax=Araneus ventricosus TaxID=182803 RepID=A0A4Y2V3I5_ARAVE|nr:hypothetical protein AVEN_36579-1 [Araneus ventricosus]GBO19072.1 hypothetical protein AVEN_272937-1 [Araneus ventricosus]
MTSNIQTYRFLVDGVCPKFERNLQIMCKDHRPNFIPVALIVFELSCSQKDTHIPKLFFPDSGRSKTWRFVNISSSNFLTITILSLCILRTRESKKCDDASRARKISFKTSGNSDVYDAEFSRVAARDDHSAIRGVRARAVLWPTAHDRNVDVPGSGILEDA